MAETVLKVLADGTRVLLVDGSCVRHRIDVNFVQGGHGYVYRYIPKDEIWVERMLDPDDQAHNLAHEILEQQLMKHKRYTYEHAHRVATEAEERERRRCAESSRRWPTR